MGKEKPEEIEEKVRSYLGLNHHLVGIRISEENVDGNHPTVSMTFCRAVREALRRKELVIGIDDLSCPNAELCLGFREPMFVDVEPRIKAKTRAEDKGQDQGCVHRSPGGCGCGSLRPQLGTGDDHLHPPGRDQG
jgi:hypothetical protein